MASSVVGTLCVVSLLCCLGPCALMSGNFLFISFGRVMGSVAADINCAGWVGWFVYLGFMAGAESLSLRVGQCLGKLQGRRWGPSGCFHFFLLFPFSFISFYPVDFVSGDL